MQNSQNQDSLNHTSLEVKSIEPLSAWKELIENKNSFLVDVRTIIELENDGIPDLSSINKSVIHIPLDLESDQPILEFKKNLLWALDKSDTILFLCRSGKRSHYCTKFCSDEYAFAYNVLGGFCGGDYFDWINSGLPWKLAK